MRRWSAGAGAALLRLGLRALVAGRPQRMGLEERLAMFPTSGLPLEKAAEIRWNESHIPVIRAGSDRDLGISLGLVHAHLRLAQIEMWRHIALGRLSEILGPVALDYDHSLRIMDFGRAVPEILRFMPEETRTVLDGFVEGLNHYQSHAVRLPHEYRLLGFEPEDWTQADVLTIGRLASADTNWLVWMQLLKIMGAPDWPEIWAAVTGQPPLPHLAGRNSASDLEAALAAVSRSGSNAYAIGASRSATGAALLAGDPHLPVGLPVSWLAAILHTPANSVAGLMIPGLPAIAIGRNRHIAWGGTSLNAAVSELVEVTAPEAITSREDSIFVRWGATRRVAIRDCPSGPILSDAPALGLAPGRPIALRWAGHLPSDELTALLRVNRARNWDEFRAATDGLGIPGQNLVYADSHGRVGKLMAAHLPRRPVDAPHRLVSPAGEEADWNHILSSSDLPAEFQPERAHVVSANDRPPVGDFLIGWFFSSDQRVRRLEELITAKPQLDLSDLMQMQRDVLSREDLSLAQDLARRGRKLAGANSRLTSLLLELEDWDGRYDVDSSGALGFETASAHLVGLLQTKGLVAGYEAVWNGRSLIQRAIRRSDPQRFDAALVLALRRAARDLRRWRVWGRMHRLRLEHPFGAVPLLGRRYRFADLASGGGADTLLKRSSPMSARRHTVRYGSNARFLADMANPDETYVMLLGGQDGWLGSTGFADQVSRWQAGQYCQLPLQIDSAEREFERVLTLHPTQAPPRNLNRPLSTALDA